MPDEVFYVVLSSNASLNVNPKNTVATYKVRLAKPIKFPHGTEWEVGLKDMSFTRSWYNLNYEQKIKFLNIEQDEYGTLKKTVSEQYSTLAAGTFLPPRQLCVNWEFYFAIGIGWEQSILTH